MASSSDKFSAIGNFIQNEYLRSLGIVVLESPTSDPFQPGVGKWTFSGKLRGLLIALGTLIRIVGACFKAVTTFAIKLVCRIAIVAAILAGGYVGLCMLMSILG